MILQAELKVLLPRKMVQMAQEVLQQQVLPFVLAAAIAAAGQRSAAGSKLAPSVHES